MSFKHKGPEISKSKRKREAFDYRTEYFKKYPGLLGCIWFCSQCGKILVGKNNVQVDHIVPLAGCGINRTFNTVAICPRCNQKKKAKGGIYIVKGSIAKIIEKILFTIQKIIVLAVVGAFFIITFPLRLLLKSLSKLFVFGGAFVKIGMIVTIILLVRYLAM